MSIGFYQIIIVAGSILLLVGTGYFGIYICKQNPSLKKYITKKNIVIISLAYIVIVSFISGKNAAYGIGAFFTPFVISLINSFFRNSFKFKKTFDEKFYQFFLGVLAFGLISTTIAAIA